MPDKVIMTPVPHRIARLAQPANLLRSWHHLDRQLAPTGRRTRGVERFNENLTENIENLSRSLVEGTYTPGTLAPLSLRHPHSKPRQLLIPTVPDRILSRALHDDLVWALDLRMSPMSHAYRPGLGVRSALENLRRLQVDTGATHALTCDIRDCFGSIRAEDALEVLAQWGCPQEHLLLLRKLFSRTVRGDSTPFPFLPQGDPLSPLLANAFMTSLDERLMESGVAHIRYADDICVVAASAEKLQEGVQVARDHLDGLGLGLNAEKEHVMSFVEGFTFLGESVDPTCPLSGSVPVASSVLYVAKVGAHVRVRKGRVEVMKGEAQLLSIPQNRVERLVTFGPISVSAGFRQWALYSGVDWVVLSARGRLLGVMTAYSSGKAVRRRLEQAAIRPDQCTDLVREQVHGKIAHCITLLRRYGVGRKDQSSEEGLRQLRVALDTLPERRTIDSIRGCEGAAAAAYWKSYSGLVPSVFGFGGRRYRPAPDVVNAALSYGYALLTGEAVAALCANGLDPSLGFLHTPKDRRASLALDLIEEFRPLIVDTTVLEMARREMLEPSTQHGENNEVRLSQKSKRRLLERFETRMTTVFAHPSRKRCSYRRAMHLQAQAVASTLDTGHLAYRSLPWRI